jgi:hypothetical protein
VDFFRVVFLEPCPVEKVVKKIGSLHITPPVSWS